MKEINYWNLKPGDKVIMNGQTYSFRRMDGMYGQWYNTNGDMVIFGIRNKLIKQGDIYIITE